MIETEILIIGAGVVGLAIARELSSIKKGVIVVEKNSTFGQETSSRNSEVIHAGMYYPSGSLKANLCIEGREILYEICQENEIQFNKIGKLIIATDSDESAQLERILRQGRDNGVSGLTMVDKKEIVSMEPNALGLVALLSVETGIIDTHKLMQYYLDYAVERGVLVAYNCEVFAVEKKASRYLISVKNNGELEEISSRVVINCAGLDSDYIAKICGIDLESSNYKLHYCKGEYFRLKDTNEIVVNRLIYPVVSSKSAGLGIHVTLDLRGGVRFGPDDHYMDNRTKDYSVDLSKRRQFHDSVRKILPILNEDQFIPDTAGIRPKLQGPDDNFRDFIINDEQDRGFPGLINLIGIESPGLTASPAIAKYVKILCENYA